MKAPAGARPGRSPARPGCATAAIPGTCGELLQGWLEGGPLLVSCPIDRFATATVAIRGDGRILAPPDRPKARRAAELALSAFGRPGLGARVTIRSDLPWSKGYGSSTADIAAVLYAAAWALGRHPDPAAIARLAVRIEPTDSTPFPGLTAFDHRAGTRHESLGAAPPLHLAVIDLGGIVDTIAFHRAGPTGLPAGDARPAELSRAYDLLRRGIEFRRADLIGRAATISAELHQALLPKPELPALIELVEGSGGLGVVVAHSGTLVGLLTDRGPGHAAALARRAEERLRLVEPALVARLIDGGVRRPTQREGQSTLS